MRNLNQIEQISTSVLKELRAMSTKKESLNTKIDNLTAEVQRLTKMLGNGTRDNIKPQIAMTPLALVMQDIKEHPGTVRKEIAERLHMDPLQVTKAVSELASNEKLIKLGSRRTTRWFTPDSLAKLSRG